MELFIKKISNFNINSLFNYSIISLLLFSCQQNYTPKPKAYFRLDFPAKKYENYNCSDCPFTFDLPTYAAITRDSNNLQEIVQHPCWFNIRFYQNMATIYVSYTKIDAKNPYDKLIKDTYKLTYKHSVRADYIDETLVQGKNKNVKGILYDVGGNAATGVQFYVTDEKQHFLRGSLYFNCPPNADSLQPAIQFYRQDIIKLVETLAWK